jgi:phosphatidylserine decarboxylase
MKKCEFCGKEIDIHKGHYVNLYTNPFEMHTYHESCYKEYLKGKRRPGHYIDLDKFGVEK